MHMNISHRNINFSAIGILAYALFFATGNSGAGLLNDPPMWESGPADSPVDTRIYIVDNYRKTIAVNGWEKAPPVKVMDAPMRVQAAITPAKIVYTDPDSGEILGVSEYIGNTIFGFNRYREYQTDNDGYIDLVSRNASIMRVKALEDGYAANDPRHGKMYWYCQEIREERTAGVGIHMGTPARGLWVDCNPDSNDSPFPGTKGKSKGKGETGASSGSPAKQPPPTSGAATSGSSQIPGMPQSAWSGDEPRQPRQPMTSAQKQLMLSDMEIQISQLEGRLQQLQFDKIRAEGNLQRAIAINVGVVMAQAQVTQVIQQINTTQFQLTMLRQQRIVLMSQP